ncbi:transmembrane protein 151A-like [Ischnura elegans]|uniref:transmembrane protein 151A-like n=1 Tax=Ischnura elegans TaxID=197161 RepID=UPI001ED872CA|nr:transmembrane protein 151A-like [Ischnura elegans]
MTCHFNEDMSVGCSTAGAAVYDTHCAGACCSVRTVWQRPIQQTLWATLQKEANWKCLVLTLLIYGCLGAVTWCRLTEVTKVVFSVWLSPIKRTPIQTSPCGDGYVYVPVAFMAMLYLVYLVECWHCTARLRLETPKVDIAAVTERVRRLREARPLVWWKVVCYHYVRRKRQVTRYRHGDAYAATQVYYERVNSHAAGGCFVFAYCGVRDASRPLGGLARHPVTRVRFSKGFAFANAEAAAEFEEQRARFFAEHERYDDYMEMREGLDLHGVPFREGMVACRDPDRPPWFARRFVFWLLSAALLSWPLRVLIEYNTATVHYQVTKLFGVNYLTPEVPAFSLVPSSPNDVSWAPCGGRSSRGSTVDSGDLERIIRENTALVPSYSEALLMDVAGQEEGGGGAAVATASGGGTAEEEEAEGGGRGGGNGGEVRLLPRPPSLPTPSLPCRLTLFPRPEGGGRRGSGGRRARGGGAGGGLSGRRPYSRASFSSLAWSPSQAPRGPLFYPSPLAESSPADPFGGRTSTTPAEGDPPPYEEALGLSDPFHNVPTVAAITSRLRRSFTDTRDICRRLRDHQRRSCTEDADAAIFHEAVGRGGERSSTSGPAVSRGDVRGEDNEDSGDEEDEGGFWAEEESWRRRAREGRCARHALITMETSL